MSPERHDKLCLWQAQPFNTAAGELLDEHEFKILNVFVCMSLWPQCCSMHLIPGP